MCVGHRNLNVPTAASHICRKRVDEESGWQGPDEPRSRVPGTDAVVVDEHQSESEIKTENMTGGVLVISTSQPSVLGSRKIWIFGVGCFSAPEPAQTQGLLFPQSDCHPHLP